MPQLYPSKGRHIFRDKTMLEALDFDLNVISRVIIAGGWSGINIDNSIRIESSRYKQKVLYLYWQLVPCGSVCHADFR